MAHMDKEVVQLPIDGGGRISGDFSPGNRIEAA